MSSVVQNSSHPSLSYADSMATSTSDTILLIGRVLLGWIFLRSGYGKIFDIPAYAATFPGRGLPTFLAYIAVPAEFFGGIALILGLATRYVVIVMIVFMLVATFSSHRYWEFADAAVRRAQDSSFYKKSCDAGRLFVSFCGRVGTIECRRLATQAALTIEDSTAALQARFDADVLSHEGIRQRSEPLRISASICQPVKSTDLDCVATVHEGTRLIA